MSTAKDEGFCARQNDVDREENPYRNGSNDEFKWFEGWDEADNQSKMDLVKMERATDLKK